MSKESLVIQDLRRHLSGGNLENGDCQQVALPVAAIKSLLGVIQRTNSGTMMGMEMELKQASDEMLKFANDPFNSNMLGGRSHIALASGCELFLKYITRCFLELPDFNECIEQIISRGQRFSDISIAAKERIASTGTAFIQPGSTVMTHGWSSVVSSLLIQAAKDTHFEIIILEGRPDASGAKSAASCYAKAGIPTTVILDSAMAHVMERVDMVIVGAEGVVENGGIINKIGTYAMAIAAKELGKPFYVAAESFKFARLYPLNQSDLPTMGEGMEEHLKFVDTACWMSTGGAYGKGKELSTEGDGSDGSGKSVPGLVVLPKEVKVENSLCDYTPAKYITLLLTDLGVLTPSAVSDELIRLYQ
jgi:translation initiation factor eIF-2B subunit alpha